MRFALQLILRCVCESFKYYNTRKLSVFSVFKISYNYNNREYYM